MDNQLTVNYFSPPDMTDFQGYVDFKTCCMFIFFFRINNFFLTCFVCTCTDLNFQGVFFFYLNALFKGRLKHLKTDNGKVAF